VGFNMSWIFVDGVDEGDFYEALDVAPTGETPDRYELGTSHVPLAGATLKSGWCAVFAKYALVMDLTIGTSPPRLMRLPARSRSVICVVLEHAMISYASCLLGGRHIWQIRHDSSQGREHLEASGDLPAEFAAYCALATDKQRAQQERLRPDQWGTDYVFDVPLDTAATITGYWHYRTIEDDFFRNLQTLVPTSGNVLTKLSQPPNWWQVTGSTKYE
jgi:hypothetical protein